jgi:hypothetical protein
VAERHVVCSSSSKVVLVLFSFLVRDWITAAVRIAEMSILVVFVVGNVGSGDDMVLGTDVIELYTERE